MSKDPSTHLCSGAKARLLTGCTWQLWPPPLPCAAASYRAAAATAAGFPDRGQRLKRPDWPSAVGAEAAVCRYVLPVGQQPVGARRGGRGSPPRGRGSWPAPAAPPAGPARGGGRGE